MSKLTRKDKLEKKMYEKMTVEELIESLNESHKRLTELRRKREEMNNDKKRNTNKNK